MAARLGAEDKSRIDLMFTSIREAEKNLHRAESWTNSAKPKVECCRAGRGSGLLAIDERETLWYDIARLAFQTDSTR